MFDRDYHSGDQPAVRAGCPSRGTQWRWRPAGRSPGNSQTPAASRICCECACERRGVRGWPDGRGAEWHGKQPECMKALRTGASHRRGALAATAGAPPALTAHTRPAEGARPPVASITAVHVRRSAPLRVAGRRPAPACAHAQLCGRIRAKRPAPGPAAAAAGEAHQHLHTAEAAGVHPARALRPH